jgi:dipeptidyl aminopeptidase/acylaminoacyl peptidase
VVRAIVLTVSLVVCGWAQTSKLSLDAAIDSLYAVRGFEQVAISPDGSQVAWVQRLNSGGSGIFVSASSSPGQAPKRVSAGSDEQPRDEGHIAWSADGKQLAFLSDAASSGQLQLYVSDLSGAPARQLTKLQGYVDAPSWSPDGKALAILFTENAPRAVGPLMPMTPETGVQDLRTAANDGGCFQR